MNGRRSTLRTHVFDHVPSKYVIKNVSNLFTLAALLALFLLVICVFYRVFSVTFVLTYGFHVENPVGLSGCILQPGQGGKLHIATWGLMPDIQRDQSSSHIQTHRSTASYDY